LLSGCCEHSIGMTFGMAEESLAFYVLVITVMIAAKYDAMVGALVILLGAGIGVLGSTVNPFATGIASGFADVPLSEGLVLRLVILVVGLAVGIWFVLRYVERVRRDPAASLVYDMKEQTSATSPPQGTRVPRGCPHHRRRARNHRRHEQRRDHGHRSALGRECAGRPGSGGFRRRHVRTLPAIVLPDPSSSGLATVAMPIMAPLAEVAGADRSLVVTAYQSASGLLNPVTPTSAVVMGGLAIARVPYGKYLLYVWPLLAILAGLTIVVLAAGAYLA